jgi:hypothetical protein
VPAAAVIPAPIVYGRVAAVKKLVVGLKGGESATKAIIRGCRSTIPLKVEVDGGLFNERAVS